MEVGLGSTLLAGDPRLVDHIVGEVKSQGIFDQFRKECIADVDTKPAYQNLRTRVESSVKTFLCKQTWKPDMNKNQLRENLRKHIHDAAYLDAGVERIVDQVVNPKVYSVFMPQIEDVVYKFLGIDRPKDRERNGTKSLKDLLPKDLDPVSPESDKNSLKDVSLESVDANMAATSEKNDQLPKDANKIGTNFESNENENEGLVNDNNLPNKSSENSGSQLECSPNNSSKNQSASNLNVSAKSDDKTEEEEEDSPMFEPIDIMNFNESNDSHLSGISELTSHRSRSPDFSNDFSRDNLDFSNHDSQLSKVSSDSRLSIVTDFGLSNHASTPMPESLKEDSNKEKSVEFVDSKCIKDNLKEILDIELNKLNAKEVRKSVDLTQTKENIPESKDCKDSKNIKGSLDSTDGGMKDKNDSKDAKDQPKDSDAIKIKSSKEKEDGKESKTHKDRDRDHRKRQSSHSSSKYDKTDKYSKDKNKEKSEKSRDSSEKCKEPLDKSKEAEKPKEDKKDSDRKESAKDLKDMYKEKIRELREKKELTEKEKLAKDPKDSKPSKESRDRKDSSKDRRDSKSSSSKSSSRHDDKSNKNDEKSVFKPDSKSSSRGTDSKESRNESKDKGKRDDKRQSKDSKESRSKSHVNARSDSGDKGDKSDTRKDVKNDSQSKDSDRNERTDTKREIKSESQASDTKKDSKTDFQIKDFEKTDKSEAKKDPKSDSQSRERKRKDDKKTKAKDDHSSLRKNPNDRRSTDRDGSNGSNSKNSQKSSSSSNVSSSKASSTNLPKESSGTSNSSSETSDNVDVSPSDGTKKDPVESNHRESVNKVKTLKIKLGNDNKNDPGYYVESDLTPKRVDLGQNELSLPLKKRPLQADAPAPNPNDFKVKKPKFAKNFQEAKKLMKIRKKLEKQRIKEYEAAKEKFDMASHSTKPDTASSTVTDKKSLPLPDHERVQIIEVTDDDYEEPYPDLSMKEMNISLERQSITSLENPLIINPQDKLLHTSEKQSNLSAMEKSIRQSLADMISDKKLIESGTPTEYGNSSAASVKTSNSRVSGTTISIPKKGELDSEKRGLTENETSAVKIQIPKRQDVQTDEAEKHDKATACKEERNVIYSSSTIHSGPIISPGDNTNTSEEYSKETPSSPMDDNCNCLYFEADNERAVKFSKFLQSVELEVLEDITCPQSSSESLEKILESLGGQIVSVIPKSMAPPMPKRKHSTSPLMDILLNTTNNNNNRHKIKELTPEEESNVTKKRRLGRPKKQRAVANVCAIQNLPNGENFVMPLSPESDVSASSEKNSLHLLKEDKSRQRSSQRYSSDDLYKPRPFFSSSSKRSRRSNQA